MITTWTFGIVLVALASIAGALSVALVRRTVPLERLREHNDVATPIHAAISVLYAVLLAFVVVVVWEQLNDADQAVTAEAGAAVAIHRDLEALDAPSHLAVHNAMVAYLQSVIHTEWPGMMNSQHLIKNSKEYDALWRSVRDIAPGDERQRIWLTAIVDRLNTIDDARDVRWLECENAVPAAMWLMLTCGAVITTLFAAFFGARHGPTHMVMVATLAAVMALSLFLIAAIDHPFIGAVRVEPEAIIDALRQINQ